MQEAANMQGATGAPSAPSAPSGVEGLALRTADKVLDMMTRGVDLADALGLSETQLEAVYGLGHNLYTEGDFGRAIPVFEWLCRHRPLEVRFLKGLGASRQMAGAFRAALDAYGLAALLEVDDPEPSFHAAECLLHVGEKTRAAAALDAAEEQAGDNRRADLLDRIGVLRARHGLTPGASGDTEETAS